MFPWTEQAIKQTQDTNFDYNLFFSFVNLAISEWCRREIIFHLGFAGSIFVQTIPVVHWVTQ